jgi:DNA-binding NtrC family response regulator
VTILLLSSEPVVRTVLKQVLEGAGYMVETAGDLAAAVEVLDYCPIDLLITHPYIANVPGHEAAKYLRTKRPGMRVLVVAGIPDDDRLQYRADLERFEIFPRPFTAVEFLKEIAGILHPQAARVRRGTIVACTNDNRTATARKAPQDHSLI